MNRLREALALLYRGLLAGYPPRTRREFGDEMFAVFNENALRWAGEGLINLLGFFLRELRDWPLALYHAHRDEWLERGIQDSGTVAASSGCVLGGSEDRMNTSDDFILRNRRQSFRGSLPPLLLGTGIMLAAIIRTDVWYRLPSWQLYLSVGVTLLPGLIVAGVGLVALLRRIPDWGITWLGSAFMGFVLSLQVMLGELVEEGAITLAPAVELILGLTLFLAGLALLLLLALRGWSRSGLFTLAAASTMALSLVQAVTAAPFSRDDLAMLAGPIGLCSALLIYFYCQKPGITRGVVLILTALLNASVVIIPAQAVKGWGMAPEAIAFVPPLLVLMTGLLAAGPLSGLLVKPILRWVM